ncbi:MAG: outer membrane beta-barrel protein [Flavobacteriaceae bacterium]|nr:porin family protein [Bacteroidia bacterium]MBT8288165.1 porin family protein [Bacteroidia bacterium]NNF74617.1 outer membrane beta-barrel protein [Flavobacteriaceae bacterium]NNK72975.1 outer membrane beta-barrel protein [Flavobacteriaceae bacterium]
MKRFLLFTVVALLGFGVQAQDGFKAGINLGLPIGDAGDLATFSIVVDLGYHFEVSDSFSAGIVTGYSHSFGDELDLGPLGSVDVDDIQFIPLAAAGRLALSDEFSLGVDLGYAIGVNDGNDGGFYYAPRIQYGVSDGLDIVGAYRGVSVSGGSFDIITLGVEFGF